MSLSHLLTCSVCRAMQPRSEFPDADAGETGASLVCRTCVASKERLRSDFRVGEGVRLFSPNGVVLATLAGGFIGGGITMALNYYWLGRRDASPVTLLAAFGIAFLYMAAVLVAVPAGPVTRPLSWLIPCVIAHLVARSCFGETVDLHVGMKGETRTLLGGFVVGLLGFPLTIGIFMTLAVLLTLLGIPQA